MKSLQGKIEDFLDLITALLKLNCFSLTKTLLGFLALQSQRGAHSKAVLHDSLIRACEQALFGDENFKLEKGPTDKAKEPDPGGSDQQDLGYKQLKNSSIQLYGQPFCFSSLWGQQASGEAASFGERMRRASNVSRFSLLADSLRSTTQRPQVTLITVDTKSLDQQELYYCTIAHSRCEITDDVMFLGWEHVWA